MLVVVNVVCRSRSAPQVRPVMEEGRDAISGLNHFFNRSGRRKKASRPGLNWIVQAAGRKRPDRVPSTVQAAEERVEGRSAPQVRPVMEVGRNAISGLNHCPLIVQAAERKRPDRNSSLVQAAEESVTKAM